MRNVAPLLRIIQSLQVRIPSERYNSTMLKRVTLGIVVVLLLLALLAYSQQRLEPFKVSGFVEADEIRLGSRVGGRVAAVHCEEGRKVRAGELLVTLEEFDLDERLAQAEASVAVRRAEWARLTNGFREEEIAQAKARVDGLTAALAQLRNGPREEEIEAGRARLSLAGAQQERAQRTYDRVSQLFATETGTVTREAVDRATEEIRVAEQMVKVREHELQLLIKGTRDEEIAAAEAQLEEARQAWQLVQRGSRQEDIDQAAAALASAVAAVAVVQAQRDELEIRSPVEGIVEAIELQKGDLVGPGAPVLSVMDTSALWVRAYVPENRLDFQLDQGVDVTVDSYPERFSGRITFLSRQAEFTPNNVQTPEERSKQVFRIKVTLSQGLDKLRPGMAADVWLDRSSASNQR